MMEVLFMKQTESLLCGKDGQLSEEIKFKYKISVVVLMI